MLKFLPDVFLKSTGDEEPQGKLTVCSGTGKDLDEICDRTFVIALIKSVDNNDHGEDGLCQRHNWVDHQTFELPTERPISNKRVALQDTLNVQFRGRERIGKLISECGQEAVHDTSVPCPMEKKETSGKSVAAGTSFGNGL